MKKFNIQNSTFKIYIVFIMFFPFFIIPCQAVDKDAGEFSLAGKESTSNSGMALIYLGRAKQRLKDGEKDAARADFEKACLLDPALAEAFPELGGDTVDAEKWVKKAGSCVFMKDRITCYKKAVKIDPAHKRAWYLLGKANYKEKHFKDAADAFDILLSMDPEYPGAKGYLRKTRKALEKSGKKE